jgi:ATP-dependent DNA ligase
MVIASLPILFEQSGLDSFVGKPRRRLAPATDVSALLRSPVFPLGSPRSALQARAAELKLDGYRAITAKAKGRVSLRSRNEKDFGPRYPVIAEALANLPDET